MSEKAIIIGGGAAGFFAAIACAEANPEMEVIILEKSKNVLEKVKISGGGRCNVTHACFDPKELTSYYPRGGKELLGPFNRFMTGDLMEWFSDRGIELKIEEDNRVFPVSDNSQTIIDCLTEFAERAGVRVVKQMAVENFWYEDEKWNVKTQDKEVWQCDKLLVASGSSKKLWDILKKNGHKVIPPVPSLFTFNTRDKRIKGLSGISVPKAEVEVANSELASEGPLLITHWGFSGPAVLKLSAWGALELKDRAYHFPIMINWIEEKDYEEVYQTVNEERHVNPRKRVSTHAMFGLPLRLWKMLLESAKIPEKATWSDLSVNQAKAIAEELTMCVFQVNGKSTFKEEFVTAGGVDLLDIDFKRFESKKTPGLFIAGEALNIDAVTGGFNFQAAWTGGWIAGNAMAGYEV
ncbi:MAG: NAD(P)/FAD-dependent oxidoreductase [Schleiferiaceae bacterium]|jgi:predicted Rossmann fold flavoprotein|nr:NAD(P)/FAD-dependent oxidoreductase [Schleiferiaceae bacterium]